MSKEERFETQFDGNKWLVADKENDTLLGGFGSAKMLNEFVDKVADLEAKLAEKNLRIEELESQFGYECECNAQFVECQKENELLKQQLAEKELEAIRWEEHFNNAKMDYEYLKEQLAEKDELIGTLKNKYECADRELYLTKDTLKHHTNIYNSFVESRTQDKISFAVEQLEKVKEMLQPYLRFDINLYLQTIENIDNQIEQLKEMSDE